MDEQPSAELLTQLDRLGLATAEQVASVRARVRKLAGTLPWFDSVWIDALRQARLVTAYQASELCAGRGDALLAGPFVILKPLPQCNFARVYEAREIATRRQVRLLLSELGQQHHVSDVQRNMRRLMETSAHLTSECLPPIVDSGIDERAKPYRLWATTEPAPGVAAAQWMVASGRYPPEAVFEIARQMVAALTELERLELLHADLCTAGLLIDTDGQVRLPHAGVRAILRPEEGYGSTELVPDTYDNLAPERIVDGTGPTTVSDLYACGCVWWSLLTGRGPLGGGDSLSRLQSAHRGKIVDVCRLAPETPESLAAAIRHCTETDPAKRPTSFSRLAEQLGESTAEGRASLAACVAQSGRPSIFKDLAKQRASISRHAGPWLAATAGGLLAGVIVWTLWQMPWQPPTATLDSGDTSGTPREVASGSGEGTSPGEIIELGQGAAAAYEGEAGQGGEAVRAPVHASLHAAVQEDVLLLPANRPVKLADLQLRPGLIVRGMNDSRPTIEISPAGLVVDVDDVRFDRIDFVAVEGDATSAPVAEESAALIVAKCLRIEFAGCSFQADPMQPRTAIRWDNSKGQAARGLGTGGQGPEIGPTEQLLLMSNCLIRGTAAGVAMKSTANRAIELHNTLLLGPGPLLLVDGCPRLDEPLSISLSHVTLRGAAALVEFRYESVPSEPGRVTIVATNSVFAPKSGGSLFFCNGLPSPARLLQQIQWTGEGSLLADDAIVASWLSDTASPMLVDDAELAIDGLARSRFAFAGSDLGDAASSQIVNWSAPLATKTPPGIRRQVVLRTRND